MADARLCKAGLILVPLLLVVEGYAVTDLGKNVNNFKMAKVREFEFISNKGK